MSEGSSRDEKREQRLQSEFAKMLALRRPGALFDFRCADLTDAEGEAFLGDVSFEIIWKGAAGFVPPDDFQRRFPNQPPEKYLIRYTCTGLARREDLEVWRGGGGPPAPPTSSPNLVTVSEHLVEAVFGWEYPSSPPFFIWWTPIWHPNIRQPYLCTEGRPFAVSTGLDAICLFAGEMIQYRSYNILSPLNKDAAKWAAEHASELPVDRRSLLDGRERSSSLVTLVADGTLEIDEGGGSRALVELT